jgi:hypothetical protein
VSRHAHEYWEEIGSGYALGNPQLDNSKSIDHCRLSVEQMISYRFCHGASEIQAFSAQIGDPVIFGGPMKFCHFRHSAGFRLIPWPPMGLDGVGSSRRARRIKGFRE